MEPINRSFFDQNTVKVAEKLLGALIVRKIGNQEVIGKIVETEAYCFNQDPASHAFRGKTKRNTAMFGPVGHAYVYFIYGNHFCFNVVAREKDTAAGAVLIRAIEPIAGKDIMVKNRKKDDILISNGPGKLTQALQITKKLNGINVTKKDELYLAHNSQQTINSIIAAERIGITVGTEKLWRFYLENNQYISKK